MLQAVCSQLHPIRNSNMKQPHTKGSENIHFSLLNAGSHRACQMVYRPECWSLPRGFKDGQQLAGKYAFLPSDE